MESTRDTMYKNFTDTVMNFNGWGNTVTNEYGNNRIENVLRWIDWHFCLCDSIPEVDKYSFCILWDLNNFRVISNKFKSESNPILKILEWGINSTAYNYCYYVQAQSKEFLSEKVIEIAENSLKVIQLLESKVQEMEKKITLKELIELNESNQFFRTTEYLRVFKIAIIAIMKIEENSKAVELINQMIKNVEKIDNYIYGNLFGKLINSEKFTSYEDFIFLYRLECIHQEKKLDTPIFKNGGRYSPVKIRTSDEKEIFINFSLVYIFMKPVKEMLNIYNRGDNADSFNKGLEIPFTYSEINEFVKFMQAMIKSENQFWKAERHGFKLNINNYKCLLNIADYFNVPLLLKECEKYMDYFHDFKCSNIENSNS